MCIITRAIRKYIRRLLLTTLGNLVELPRARHRLVQSTSSSDQAILARVSLHLHSQDGMYQPFHPDHYLAVGLSAMHCIESSLAACLHPLPEIKKILDFPCGYGRVMRFLRVRYPYASIYAAETNKAALDFCCKEFNAKSVPTSQDFDMLDMGTTFDLIWCGSLITHLNEVSSASLLRCFFRHLSPRGVCVFTTHGLYPAENIESGASLYRLSVEARKTIVNQYRETGYGFADYTNCKGYGISLVTPERIRSIMNGSEVLFIERGWDNHQDVYAYQRVDD